MMIGIGSWTYPWAAGRPGYDMENRLCTFDVLDRASDMGMEVVQICDNMPLHKLGESQLLTFKKKSLDRGIRVETGTRGVAPDHLLEYLKIAEKLDAKLVRTIITEDSTDEGIKTAEGYLRNVLPSFEKAGVILAIENHERHTAIQLASIMESLDSPFLGICLDTVNSLGANECLEKVFDVLAPFTVCLHVKDYEIKRNPTDLGFIVTGAKPGTGMLDIHCSVNRLKELGREFNVILEQWPPFTDTLENTIDNEASWAEAGAAILKKIKMLSD